MIALLLSNRISASLAAQQTEMVYLMSRDCKFLKRPISRGAVTILLLFRYNSVTIT